MFAIPVVASEAVGLSVLSSVYLAGLGIRIWKNNDVVKTCSKPEKICSIHASRYESHLLWRLEVIYTFGPDLNSNHLKGGKLCR